MNKKRGCILLFAVCCLVVIFAGCSKEPDSRANIMFVNGCAGSNSIYAWGDNKKIVGAANILYTKTSNYQKLASGRSTINFYYSVNGKFLCGASSLYNIGDYYSLFAGGLNTAPTFVVTTDDMTLPVAGNARIRFINLSSDVPSEDLAIGTQTIATGVANGTCTPFYEVTAGTYLAKATSAGTPAVSDSLKLEAGLLYTAMLTGSQAGSGNTALTLSMIANR